MITDRLPVCIKDNSKDTDDFSLVTNDALNLRVIICTYYVDFS